MNDQAGHVEAEGRSMADEVVLALLQQAMRDIHTQRREIVELAHELKRDAGPMFVADRLIERAHALGSIADTLTYLPDLPTKSNPALVELFSRPRLASSDPTKDLPDV